MAEPSEFEVVLEVREASLYFFTRWSLKTVKLVGQSLNYVDESERMTEVMTTDHSFTKKITSSDGDNKDYPFMIQKGKLVLVFNAAREEIREQCITVFNLSACDDTWVYEFDTPVYREHSTLEVIGLPIKWVDAPKSTSSTPISKDGKPSKLTSMQQQVVKKGRIGEGSRGIAMNQEMVHEYKETSHSNQSHCANDKDLQLQTVPIAVDISAANATHSMNSCSPVEDTKGVDEAKQEGSKGAQEDILASVAPIIEEPVDIVKLNLARAVQSRFRLRRAKRIVQEMMAQLPLVVLVSINRLDGQTIPLINETVCLVGGLKRRLGAGKKVEGLDSQEDEMNVEYVVRTSEVVGDCTLTSAHRTPPIIKNGGNHVTMATCTSKLSYLNITVLTKDKSSANFEPFGTVTVDLSKLPEVPCSAPVDMIVPLEGFAPDHAKLLSNQPGTQYNANAPKPAQLGCASLTVCIPDMNYTMCGWIYKASEALLSNAWKRRWFVLIYGHLQYFNDIVTLGQPKHVIACKDISAIREYRENDMDLVKISYRSDAVTGFWVIHWDADQDANCMKRMWLRKLYRNCPNIDDPTLNEAAKVWRPSSPTNRSTSFGSGGTDKLAINTNVKTRVPMKKRLSFHG